MIQSQQNNIFFFLHHVHILESFTKSFTDFKNICETQLALPSWPQKAFKYGRVAASICRLWCLRSYRK